MQRRIFGNKEYILKKRQELTDWEILINTIAAKSKDELEVWFNSHFSGLSTDNRTGLELIVKALWAMTKILNK
jgi:hypothetical protein